jgi:hypothetical membrane protein
MTANVLRLATLSFQPWRLISYLQAWSGIIAPTSLSTATLIAAISATQYSHLDDSICQLGAQDRPQAWVMSIGFILYAVLVTAFALHVRHRLDSGWGRTAAKALMLHAAYALFLAFVQANPRISGVEHNAEGTLHIFLARGAMVFVWLAILASAKHYARAGRDALATYGFAAIGAGALLGVLYISQLAVEIDGMFERIMLLLVLAWFAALSLRLQRDAATARR